MEYIHRELEREFAEASRFFKAALVVGWCQAGRKVDHAQIYGTGAAQDLCYNGQRS